MAPPAAPAPDYSAAWAAYYQQQAAAASAAPVNHAAAAVSPYPGAAAAGAPNMAAYGYGGQQPYGGYSGAATAGYPGMQQPMGMQARPPVYQPPAAYTPTVGPQAYPQARPMQQPQPINPGGYQGFPAGGGGYGPAGGVRPPGPQAMPMRPPLGPQPPMGMHSSPGQSFPPAKRPRFDSGPHQPMGPGGGAGPASSFARGGAAAGSGSMPIPAAAGLPSNPMTIATPMAGPSSGSDFFGGGGGAEGRDGMSMSSRGGRGGGSMRGGKSARGGYGGGGYDDDYSSASGSSYRGRAMRGMARGSPPPGGPTGPRNSGPTGPRSDRGGFKPRGRGGLAGASHRDLPDAPRGPASTRKNKESVNNISLPDKPSKAPRDTNGGAKEDKKTLTDFKIVGLEVPELAWKWGAVPEAAAGAADETEGSSGRKRKAEGSNEDGGPSSPSASTTANGNGPPSQKQPRVASYFMTHGKENTSKAEQVTRDVNRLRIYFDSPAGQGHGEKRGKGGIEGQRAPLPPPQTPVKAAEEKPASVPPTAADVKQESVEESVAASQDGQQLPAVDALKSEDTPDVKQEAEQSSAIDVEKADDSSPIDVVKTEEGSTIDHAQAADAAVAADSAPVVAPTGDLVSSVPDLPDAVAEAKHEPVENAEDPAGDVSMHSARGSVEPEAVPAEQAFSSAFDAPSSAAEAPAPPPLSSPSKIDRDLSLAPSVSEAGVADSVRATTPAPEPADLDLYYKGPEPSDDRISILYERSTRRLCIDADVVERVRISRTEGKVELTIRWNKNVAQPVEVAPPAAPAAVSIVEEAEPQKAVEGAESQPTVEEIKTEEEATVASSDAAVEVAPEASEPAAPAVDAPADENAVIAEPDAVKPESDAEATAAKEEPTATQESSTLAASSDTVTPSSATATDSPEKVDTRTWDICRGILMEQLDEETETFKPVNFETLDDMWDGVEDPCAGWTPPIHKLITPDSDASAAYPTLKCETFKIIAYLDQDRPLSEPKWVRTGQVEDWLNELFGRMKVDNKKVSSWRGKFEILDPEPAPQTPTIQNTLDSWATNSTAGSAKERRRFVKTHLSEMDNIFEILLRLTRGERAGTAGSFTTPSNLAGPLANAVSPNSHYAGKQNHVSLAVLAMLRLTYELAEKAGVPVTDVNERVSEIIRSIPSHLLFKSVDGLFRDHLSDKKN